MVKPESEMSKEELKNWNNFKKDLLAKVKEYGLTPEEFSKELEGYDDSFLQEELEGLKLLNEENQKIIERQLAELKKQGSEIQELNELIEFKDDQIKELTAKALQLGTELEDLKKQNTSLKGQNTKLKNALAAISEEE